MHTTAVRLSLLAAVATLGLGLQPPAHAGDSLLIKRVQQEQAMNLPSRGMTTAQVEKRYGAPVRKLAPRGGGSKARPVINRWDYSRFIVYFEGDRVIHAVLNTPAGNNRNPQQAQ